MLLSRLNAPSRFFFVVVDIVTYEELNIPKLKSSGCNGDAASSGSFDSSLVSRFYCYELYLHVSTKPTEITGLSFFFWFLEILLTVSFVF